MIFKRSRSNVRFFRHTTTPGVKIGRYVSGLEAIWTWREHAHLLVVERSSYGAGENLVANVFREFEGRKVMLWPKGDCQWRESTDTELYTMTECLEELYALWIVLSERIHRIIDGEDLPDMLVALPELHDAVEHGAPETRQFLHDLDRLLKHGREGRMHVLANTRQNVIYPAYLPGETRELFSGLMVLGRTGDAITRQLGLPRSFDQPHGRLGDLTDDFWPLEVRTR